MTSTSVNRLTGASSSLAIKAPCRLATTAAITLNGLQTIDGELTVAEDRVLVKDQADDTENGIYIADTGDWVRAPDFDGNTDIVKGSIVGVTDGVANSASYWRVNNDNPIVIDTSDITFEQAIISASSAVSFLQSGTGAVSRSAQDKMRDFISVRDFGTVGDGVTSDQTAVANAVAAALAQGQHLYWPAGTYLTTASVANFHDVTHFGPGIVKRGSTLFYISPELADTNTLYVSTTGSNSNDGLTSTDALLTVQKACDVVAEFAPRLPGRWVIQLAAGTYTENVQFDTNTDSEYPVTIQGPDVTHPTVPTAIIAAATTSSSVFAADNGGHFILTDIKLQGATTSNGFKTNGSRCTLNNVHIATCLNGVNAQNGAIITARGGIWTGRGSGVANGLGYQGLFNVMHDIGGTNASDATQITAYERGMLIDEGTQGHTDFTQVSACGTGVNLKRGAGAFNPDTMTIKTCTVGFLAENNGWFDNNIQWGTGANANTVNVKTIGGSPDLTHRTVTYKSKTRRLVRTQKDTSHTGTTSPTDVLTLETIPDHALGQAPSSTEAADESYVFAYLTTSLAAGNCAFTLRLGSTNLTAVTIPSGATEVIVEGWVTYTAAAEQRTVIRAQYLSGGTWTTLASYALDTVTVLNTSVALQIRLQLGNAGDTVTINHCNYHSTIGG